MKDQFLVAIALSILLTYEIAINAKTANWKAPF
jgi:hypothetical protein